MSLYLDKNFRTDDRIYKVIGMQDNSFILNRSFWLKWVNKEPEVVKFSIIFIMAFFKELVQAEKY